MVTSLIFNHSDVAKMIFVYMTHIVIGGCAPATANSTLRSAILLTSMHAMARGTWESMVRVKRNNYNRPSMREGWARRTSQEGSC